MNNNYKVLIACLVVLLIASGIARYGVITRRKRKQEIAELYRIIRKKVGAKGTDIKSMLDKAIADTSNPKKLTEAAKRIYNAFFWKDVFGFEHRAIDDDEEAVMNVLRSLTRGEMKALLNTFKKEFGQELDDFLVKYNNSETLKSYYNIVQTLS